MVDMSAIKNSEQRSISMKFVFLEVPLISFKSFDTCTDQFLR